MVAIAGRRTVAAGVLWKVWCRFDGRTLWRGLATGRLKRMKAQNWVFHGDDEGRRGKLSELVGTYVALNINWYYLCERSEPSKGPTRVRITVIR